MPEPKRYATTFRTALEVRLQQGSGGAQTNLARLQRRVAFERLLARLSRDATTPWLLKGGYALELCLGARPGRPRISMSASPNQQRLNQEGWGG